MHQVAWGYSYRYFVDYSPLLLWVVRNISSHSLMIIPDMVLSSSFVRILNLWRLSKLSKKRLSSNKGRKSKWFILIEVVSIMVDRMRQDVDLNHLQSTFRNVALMLSIQCLVLLNRMGL